MQLRHYLSEGISMIELDCGKVNAFTRDDVETFESLINEAESMYGPYRVLVLRSTKVSPKGKPIFCAGADQDERTTWTKDSIAPYVAFERSGIMRLRKTSLFVVSVVDGYALGLGSEICASSDFVYATPRARFGFPEARLSLVPGAGGTAWALQNPHAFNHLIFGDEFDRDEAKRIGLVHEFAESEEAALRKLKTISESLVRVSSYSQQALKQARYEAWNELDLLKYEARAYREALSHKII